MANLIKPEDMSNLDSTFSITFISENGDTGQFYPINTPEFIDYLVELDENLTRYLLSEDFEPTEEIIDFLQEAISAYADEHDNIDYYPELKNFLENSSINELHVTIEENDEEELDEEIDESINEFFESDGWVLGKVSILESVDELLQEVSYSKVVRGGRIIKKANCPPGARWNGKQCVRMGSMEVRKRMKAALKAVRTRRKHSRNASFQRAIMKKRTKALKLRASRGLR